MVEQEERYKKKTERAVSDERLFQSRVNKPAPKKGPKMGNLEVFQSKPKDFYPAVSVSACYIEIDREILLLKQSTRKPEPGAWGVPAGKIERGESPEQAAQRELFEETGILLSDSSLFKKLGYLYMRKPSLDYIYYLFRVRIEKKPKVILSEEHQSHVWVQFQKLHELRLMTGAKETLEFYRKNSILEF